MEDTEHRPRGGRKDVHSHPEDALEADVYDLDHKVAANPAAGENTIDSLTLGGVKSAGNADANQSLQTGIEREYDGIAIPPWREQLTLRALVTAAILGILFCIITHRLNLTTGVIPSLNVCAGLLGFFFVKTYTTVLQRCGLKIKPFTRQENTVIQTCVVSCYGIAFSGGFGSYLLGMAPFAYENVGTTTPGNTTQDIKIPKLGWIYAYIFVVSLLGIFCLVPLRKIMIIDYKLIYPSGTATALLINSFHTPAGGALAKKQVRYLGKFFSISFLWSFFKWFFAGDGSCGFDNFPSLGMKALANKFFFDFNLTYVGAGMICPHNVNLSILFGGIVSWGLMWPLIQNNAGKWYPAGLTPTDFRGIYGYKVFISIALILGDGLYHFLQVNAITLWAIYLQYKNRQQLPTTNPVEQEDVMNYDEKKRNETFMKDGVPYWAAVTGYVILSIISIIVVPHIVSSVKWYYVLVAYIVGPVFAFSNAYGCGLTDWSLASNYGKILLFVFATWAGAGGGGILAGLAACGVMMSIVQTAADLMQDFKTGYLTLSSPRSMFISQLIGGVMGCVIAPATFWLFYKAFDVGQPHSIYQAPYATIYRAMALIGVEGFGALPSHCLQLCAGWFAFALLVCIIRDRVPKRVAQFIPYPMAMAIPFYIGPYFAIDMCVGTALRFIWQLTNRRKADTFSAAVASGLICGDGLWTIPSAILNFAKVYPPICMTFFSRKAATAMFGG